jgi:hypothetical protein
MFDPGFSPAFTVIGDRNAVFGVSAGHSGFMLKASLILVGRALLLQRYEAAILFF